MKNLFWMFAITILLASCGTEEAEDISGISIAAMKDRSYEFSTYGGTETIKTGEGGWTIENLNVSGVGHELTAEEKAKLTEKGEYKGDFGSLSITCADNVITLSMPPNDDVINERSFSFNIVKGNENVKISGTQQKAQTGYWGDYLGLAGNNEICFANEGGSRLINTKTDKWDIISVSVDGETFNLTMDERQAVQDKEFERKFAWLTVKRDDAGLLLTADALSSGERSFKVQLFAGNYTEAVYGWQGDMSKPGGGLIGLSQTTVNFTSQGGSTTLKTLYDGWQISGVTVGDKHYTLSAEQRQAVTSGNFTAAFDWLTIARTADGLTLTASPASGGTRRYSVILSKGRYCSQQVSGSQTGCVTTDAG